MGKYFGTDGVRGEFGKDLTVEMAYRIGRFIGAYCSKGKTNRIVISRDTRISGEDLATALKKGISYSGSECFDIGVSTTPSISYLVTKEHFDYGIMISASHNPYFDNGIKIFNHNGEKLEAEIESEIEDYIDSKDDYLPLLAKTKRGKIHRSKSLVNVYINYLVSLSSPVPENFRVLVDCANGSASTIAPRVFKKIKLKADFVSFVPDGKNINENCGSTHIKSLSNLIRNGGYDFGFAFDGDADRVIFVDKKGNVIDGDSVIYILALNLKKHNELNFDKVVVTVMSNIGLKIALQKHNIDIEEVQVGDKYVQSKLKEKNLILGGEQSGHIIQFDKLNTGDGFITVISVLNAIISEKKCIDSLINGLVIYPQVLKNVKVKSKELLMNNQSLKTMIDKANNILEGNGRVLVRPSGTEPCIRVMCEAKTIDECHKYVDEISKKIENLSGE